MQYVPDSLARSGLGDASREADGFRTMLGAQLAIKHVLDQTMLAAFGIRSSQGRALVQLARGGAMSCQRLASVLGCGTSRLTRLAQDLERRALIVRCRDDRDRRALVLTLTPAGMAIAERVPAIIAEAEAVAMGPLTVEERMFLARLLQRILGERDA
ncbi:MarR family transcriptional regulator [Burkholderia aenigmatica]|uniref:MarR family transcriptional regulator n=1 Tax=Burkholderia aenigmatica TaxID=2015348 RepID=A0A6J5J4M9_9BURK|nr:MULTISPECIES: MarR family winged helix-turn-helix transcriptional regulator [Burkholderia]AYQ42117.1 MarR family transcriptional regulator [Burkholderia lata]CAB3966572.1 MarR family transcriptional regulator [Burkholderia aenigmatica]VWC34966.1 MarR family transcriptional regulator [Burkholderia aenigmatica]